MPVDPIEQDTGIAADLECLYCAAPPAEDRSVIAVRGFLLFHQRLQLTGPFCRDCGLEASRGLTRTTLTQGVWSPLGDSVSAYAIGVNLLARRAFAALPEPVSHPQFAMSAADRRADITEHRRWMAKRGARAWIALIVAQLALLYWTWPEEDFEYSGDRARIRAGACATIEESRWLSRDKLSLKLCDDPAAKLRIRKVDFTIASENAAELCGDHTALSTEWVTLCVEPVR